MQAMKEELLHYAWRTRAFDIRQLSGTLGEKIDIEHFGFGNPDTGPDFMHARIRINGILWVGHVEMHVRSSDWYQHKHDSDPAYNNVVLHVVWEENTPVRRLDGTYIPCLSLQKYLSNTVKNNYQYLMLSETWIPCEKIIHNVSAELINISIEKAMIERLEQRCEEIAIRYKKSSNDLEETLYRMLLRAYGLLHNQEAMEKVAEKLPLNILKKYADDLHTLEAILIGTAGFLNSRPYCSEKEDELNKQFSFIKIKHKINPMPQSSWTFGKIRPPAFPALRLAQFASLIHHIPGFVHAFSAVEDVEQMHKILSAPASAFWQKNAHFDRPLAETLPCAGRSTRDVVIVNAILPFVFFYATIRQNDQLREKSIHWFTQIEAENNRIIKEWKRLGIVPSTAFESQALIHLKKQYCNQRKCVHCGIGNSFLAKSSEQTAAST
jgi:hypothetical protein